MCDFSIDYILNRAGDKYLGTNGSSVAIKLNSYHHHHHNHRHQDHHHHHHPYANVGADFEILHQPSSLEQMPPMFNWLHYTRYHPPRLPRSFRQVPAKRTPGRLPRIPFTPVQLQALEGAYKNSNYLSAEDANKLAESLELTNTRVKIWFQNRRARERRERREKDESCDSTFSSNASSPEPEEKPEPEMIVIV